jgi:hypothetical protein
VKRDRFYTFHSARNYNVLAFNLYHEIPVGSSQDCILSLRHIDFYPADVTRRPVRGGGFFFWEDEGWKYHIPTL